MTGSVEIGDLALELRSGFACGKQDPEGVVQFRMNNVTRSGSIDWSTLRRIPLAESKPGFELRDGDILFNATNSPELVGKTALFTGFTEAVTFSNHFIRIRLDARRAYPHYVARWLQREFEKGSFSAMCRRWVNQASVTKAQLAELKIPLPPLDEQRRIAAILDKADGLQRMSDGTSELIGRLGKGIFEQEFVLGEDRSWPVQRVADLAIDIRTGPFGSQLLHSEFQSDGIAVLGIDNAVSNEFRWVGRRYITEQKYELLKRYTVRPGDVLITIMGTTGRCAVVPDDIPVAINTKHLCCITLDRNKCIPEYLHAAFLNQPDVLRQLGVQAKGAVMPGLNMGIIKALNVKVPPMEKQQQFKLAIDAVNGMAELARSRLGQASELFSSLQLRAFADRTL